MGAKFVAAIIGVIILVVLAQTFIFGGDDGAPSVNNPSSIPTATPPTEQEEPVLLGEGDSGGESSSSGGASSNSQQTTYTVQSGDTLGAIASSQGVAAEDQDAWIQEVLDLNGMADARELQAGQELILPAVPQSSASPSATASADDDADSDEPEATPPPSATGTLPTSTPGSGGGSASTYTVVDGDTPYGIALNHCVEDPDAWVTELLEINAVDANSLSVGMELDLPPGTPAFCGGESSGEDTSTEEDDG